MAKTLATGIRRARHIAAIDEIVAARFSEVELERALVYLVDAVPAEVLPYLAEQFDVLGYKGWGLIGKTYQPVVEDPLEGITTPLVAYGIRRLNPAYSGPLVRLRRLTDNLEADFSALPEGGLNVDSIAEFLDSGEGRVVRLYNQIADEDHLESSVADNQPKFFFEGTFGGRPSIIFDGATDFLGGVSLDTTDFEFSIVASQNTGDSGDGVLLDYEGAPGIRISRNGSGDAIAVLFDGVSQTVVPYDNNKPVSLLVRREGSGLDVYVNGELRSETAVSSDASSGALTLGAALDGSFNGSKSIGELIVWPTSISEEERERSLLRSMQYYGLAAPTPEVVDEVAIDRQRRDLIKNAIELHRYKGTPFSVKEAIRSVGFRDAQVIEKVGIKYNGAIKYDASQTYGSGFPFNFRVVFDLGSQQGITAERIEDLAALIDEYKNVRSRLVDIAFEATLEEDSFATDDLELVIEFVDLAEAGLRRVLYDGAHKYDGVVQYDSTTDSLGTNI